MSGEVHFWDPQIWSFVKSVSILFAAMLAANMLRRTIKPLSKSLIPSSVLAGFLVLIVQSIYKSISGNTLFDIVTLEALTYHGLGLGIVAMTFRTTEKDKDFNLRKDIFNSGVLTVSTYLLQAILGLAISLALFYIIGSWASAGILLPMGFGQGPGQAYNWGIIYQTATDYPSFEHGASFGLSVAAMGFIVSSLGGVYYLNKVKKKGRMLNEEINAEEVEDLSAEMVTKKGEIPLAESLDKLTVQFGLVFLAYILSYAFMYALSLLFDELGGFFVGTVKPLLWGFNFLCGMLFVFIIKALMRLLRKKGIQKREYTNNFMLNRISGLMFDLMVVASISAIDLSAFKYKEFILPLLLICVVGGIATYFYVKLISEKLFKKYTDEQFLAMFGMLTGTTSTGLILLREIDPLYKTPASGNLIFQALWAIVFGFPMLLLMGVVAQNLSMTYITLAALIALFGAMILILMRDKIFVKKNKFK